jgi:hypothetical protein
MKFIDSYENAKGVFSYKAYRHEDGKKILIAEYRSRNKIVNGAKNQMAHLVAGESAGFKITQIGFGTSDAPTSADDDGLKNAFVKEVSGYSFPGDGKVLFTVILETGEANGLEIREAGLFCEDGTMFARNRREELDEDTGEFNPLPPLVKAADFSLEAEWEITF